MSSQLFVCRGIDRQCTQCNKQLRRHLPNTRSRKGVRGEGQREENGIKSHSLGIGELECDGGLVPYHLYCILLYMQEVIEDVNSKKSLDIQTLNVTWDLYFQLTYSLILVHTQDIIFDQPFFLLISPLLNISYTLSRIFPLSPVIILVSPLQEVYNKRAYIFFVGGGVVVYSSFF